jgi:streptogramin lyase
MKNKMFVIFLTLVLSILTATAIFSGTAGADEDYPPIQTIELGTPLIEDFYDTGVEWLDLIGSQTPVWINSSDAETGTDFIYYNLAKSDKFGFWDVPDYVYVYDNQQTGDPFTTDSDLNDGRISIQFYIEESCFHEIHAHCVDTVGNENSLEAFDFLVDFDAPANDDFTYIDSYLLPGGARYINNQTIKRIFANDTGCTGGVAGVDRIVWRIENNITQIIAEGIIYDNNDTGYEDANVSVSGDLDNDTEGKMIIDIQLNEECIHFIYHQAIDKLENKDSGRKQLVYVDLTPPTIFKTVGNPNCTIVTGEEYCVTPDTPITFYAEDRGCMGGVGLDTVEYNIWYNGDWTGWMLLEELQDKPLNLTRECMHYLLIRATDILGNEIEDNETFYVDITAPIIEKTVGDPNCTGCGEMDDDDYCVTTDTLITLDAFDLGCCPSGEFTIEYRIWYLGTWTNWMNYTGNITLSGECVHYLEARAYPEIIKTVGDPNCTGCGEMGDDDYCVTTDTLITLEAVEQGCCPCPNVTIEYKIGDGNWIEYIEPFNFTEECEHQLYVRAYDCLGNGMDEMYWDNETFYVDETPPEIIKTVGDPNCTGCGEMGDDDYCVTTDTLITLDAVEQGCCPCPSVTIEYKIGDDNWIEYTKPFNFTEECEHILLVRAYDCLGNGMDEMYWDNETFYVDDNDTPPPKPEKRVGDPKVKLENDSSGHDQWMIFPDTEINFTALGDDGCCPCEEVTVEYRIWYLGTWTDWMIYTGNITLSGGCVHYLEARAYDCLGNRGEIDNETFWVCTPGGDVGPDIMIIDPEFGSTHCERTLDVKINASDDVTSWEDLDVQLWISGGRRDAPTLWYEPVYNESDGLFHVFVDLYKYQDGAQITLEALAIDEDYNVEFAVPVTFTVCSTTIWDQWMQEGWNLLILPPNIGCNESVDRVLSSIDSNYDVVFYLDPDDGWLSYSPDRLPQYNNLAEIEGGSQYWVHITNEDGIRYYIGLPEIEILAPEDGATLTELDEINGNTWNSQDGIDEVNLLIYYKDELNSKYYWNGTDWSDTSYNLLCQLDDFGERYIQNWSCDSSDVEWICDETFYIRAIATDEFGCLAIDQISFDYTCFADYIPSKTYTLDADFDEGILVGLEHETVHDQLQLIPGEVSTYPALWVANSGDPSVSKWDTQTDKELARYQTFFGTLGSFGSHSGPAPSRTCVDTDGNCYVANRQFPSNKAADVIKIYADDWIDRNGNGVLDTSHDTNGNGVIEPSEMLPLVDSNGNNKIDPSEIQDERIAWVVEVGPTNGLGRSLSIDLNGNLWLGLYGTMQYYKLSSVDGSILAGPIDVSPHTPYGSLVDKHGILWGASLTTNMLKLDTNSNTVIDVFYHSAYGGNYGIALGYDESDNTQVYLGSWGGYSYIQFDSATEAFSTPAEIKYTVRGISVDADGNIICGSGSGGPGSGGVAKFAPNGSLIWSAPSQVGSTEARGSVVDSDNNVWCIHVSADKISKFNGTDGAPLGWRPSGKNPYTYSDATGIGLMSSVVVGTWDVIFDSEAADTQWDVVNWTSYETENTSLIVKIRSSNDQVAWSPWETATNGITLGSTPVGQYLQIEVTMKIISGDESPILYDLTVEATCAD